MLYLFLYYIHSGYIYINAQIPKNQDEHNIE